jgi:hypothetical protein
MGSGWSVIRGGHAECELRGEGIQTKRECHIQHRTAKEEAAGKRPFVTGRSEVELCLFSGDSGRPSKSEGRNKKEERQPPLRAKVGATLVPDSSQN